MASQTFGLYSVATKWGPSAPGASILWHSMIATCVASTTVGFERRFNPALALDDVALFVAESAAISTPRPPNMERIVELNRGPFVAARPQPSELPLPTEGAQVLDVRPFADFAEGHLPGALSVPVSGTRFSTKAAFVLDADRPLVVAATNSTSA